MDLQGSLVNTKLRIYPSKNLIDYLKSQPIDDNVPLNIIKFAKGIDFEPKVKENTEDTNIFPVYLDSKDIENLNKIKAVCIVETSELENVSETFEKTLEKDAHMENKDPSAEGFVISSVVFDAKSELDSNDKTKNIIEYTNVMTKKSKEECNEKIKEDCEKADLHLVISDIEWLYSYLQKQKSKGETNVPYLHVLLEGAKVETPQNKVIKRNPILEARCVKLRAQQEAREYRKMTKSVDNVRMRFPEDSISFQLKQVNRHLIAIGQFIISIFAGFLFGFKGVEWMIGTLDFGFRLLLGVMCALIIALAEIYFLAKKLNEELNIPETVQLGGPPKFADQLKYYEQSVKNKSINKEHQD